GPHVAGRVLGVSGHRGGLRVPGYHAVGVEVVARPIERIEHRHRVAGAPDGLVRSGIVGPGDPHGRAAGLPGVVVVLPGFAAGFAGRGYREFAPQHFAGRCIERRDPIAHAAVAARGSDDDLVL